MRGKAKWSIFVSILLVLSLFLAACSGGSKDTSGDTGSTSKNKKELADEQTLYFAESADIPSLDFAQATDTTSFEMLTMLESGLMTMVKDKPQPDLAAGEPEVSADGTVYTFKLRDGIKFSDGSPITAQDFVWSWQHFVDPKTAAQYGYIYSSANIKNAAKIMDQESDLYGKVDQLGVKAVDDKTLQVTLEKATPYFESLMAFPPFFPMKKDFVEQQGDNYAKEPNNLLYTGAYKMESWDHGEGWTLVKNPDYWNAKNITIDKVVYKVVKDETTALNLYKTDKIYTDGLSAEYVDQYKNSKEFHTKAETCVYFLKLNVDKVKAFQNVKVRQALSMALDREGLVSVLLNDGSVPAHYLVPKDFTFGPDGKDFRASAEKGYLLDGKDQAKKLWEEAKKELGISSLSLEYMTTDGSVAGKLAEYNANQLSSTLDGLKVTINKQPWGEYLKRDDAGDFQIGGGSGWCPDYQDPMTFLDMFTTGNGENTGKWSNAEYDKLIKEANDLGNKPEERWTKLQEAEKLLITEAPVIPTFQDGSAYLVKPYVEGLYYQSSSPTKDWRFAKVLKH
ncbi:MAG: ABC transporter substrate-binding protein [Tuberibacillus sp.]